jgi:4-nitrophenyl phosphatase
MAARLSTTADYKGLIDQYDTWLFDCDGVLWEGTRVIKGATEFLAHLRKLGKSTSLPRIARTQF